MAHTDGSHRWSTESLHRDSGPHKNALIILNTEQVHFSLFWEIWQRASVRYCADGGANRLYDLVMTSAPEKEDVLLPDLIKGDLDSIREDVKAYYEKKGITVVQDRDEFSTDLGKCIQVLNEYEQDKGHHQLILGGGLTGRLDQTIHTLHAMTMLSEKREDCWAVGPDSLVCILKKGKHTFDIERDYFGKTCGILPVGQTAHVITTGLEWNLGPNDYAYPTSMDTFVSTSNHLLGSHVTIETDVPITFTVEIKHSAK